MSPRVRLRCYPDSDAGFVDVAGRSMVINLPADVAMDLVATVQDRLRLRYPAAVILVEAGASGDEAWHVYRDGPPA